MLLHYVCGNDVDGQIEEKGPHERHYARLERFAISRLLGSYLSLELNQESIEIVLCRNVWDLCKC